MIEEFICFVFMLVSNNNNDNNSNKLVEDYKLVEHKERRHTVQRHREQRRVVQRLGAAPRQQLFDRRAIMQKSSQFTEHLTPVTFPTAQAASRNLGRVYTTHIYEIFRMCEIQNNICYFVSLTALTSPRKLEQQHGKKSRPRRYHHRLDPFIDQGK